MEDVFENLEIGLEAFENLIVFIDIFSNYDFTGDLKRIHVLKENGENAVIKDCIKWGVQFVREYQIAELSNDDSKPSETNSNRAKKSTWEKAQAKEPSFHLSQFSTSINLKKSSKRRRTWH
jgi:hypothetical protein